MKRKTKIVCTIGPASDSKEVLRELMNGGMNVARLNFSHGTHEEHEKRIQTIKEVREELGLHVAILLDTKGPEIRTGKFEKPFVYLVSGQTYTLTVLDCLGNEEKCSISYKDLIQDVKIGDRILIDDGLIELQVDSVTDTDIITTVVNPGELKASKGVNMPGVRVNLPAVTEKDVADIEFGIKNGVDFIAASFIRKASDVIEIRRVLEKNNAMGIQIISKIENEEGVSNLDEILAVSDGLMVARGDLGVEVPAEMLPYFQKKIISMCNRDGKPVITATQMLDSMIRNPRPTRAETNDVFNAVLDGTDAVMLSGETAVGAYPVEAVKTMAKISLAAESAMNYEEQTASRAKHGYGLDVTAAISHATATAALEMKAAAILTATSSGFTASCISRMRPKAPIVACTTNLATCRRLSLVWGVYPMVMGEATSTDRIFDIAVDLAKRGGFVSEGEIVVISAGVPVGVSGATNLLKVQLVGELLVKGNGLVRSSAVGRAVVGEDSADVFGRFREGDVLVLRTADSAIRPLLEKAAGLVVEEPDYTTPGVLVAMELKKPCLVGAYKVTQTIRDGMEVTLDAGKGIVHAGKVREFKSMIF